MADVQGPKPLVKRTTLNGEPIPTVGWLTDYVEWAASTVPSPPIFHVACGLAWAAFELARRGWIIDNGHQTRPALWWVLTSKSGGGRGLALNCLRQAAINYHLQGEALVDDPVIGFGADMRPPIVDFTGTWEGLWLELESRVYGAANANERRTVALIAHDEFHEVLARGKRHDNYITDLIGMWDQRGEMRRTQVGLRKKDRLDPRKGLITNPAVSAVFTTAEARLYGVLDAAVIESGFASRLLWLSSPAGWDPRLEDSRWLRPISQQDLRTNMRPVTKKMVVWGNATIGSGVIRFTSAVLDLHTEHALEVLSENRRLNDIYTRSPTHLLMLAAVYAAIDSVEEGGPVLVQPKHYELGRTVFRYVGGMYRRLMPLAASAHTPAVLSYLQECGDTGATLGDIAQQLRRDHAQTSREMKALVEHGVLVTGKVQTGRRGRPAILYFHPDFASRIDASGLITARK